MTGFLLVYAGRLERGLNDLARLLSDFCGDRPKGYIDESRLSNATRVIQELGEEKKRNPPDRRGTAGSLASAGGGFRLVHMRMHMHLVSADARSSVSS